MSERNNLGCGCQVMSAALLFVLLLAVVGGTFYIRLPHRLGWIKPAAERVLVQVPDRDAAADLEAELGADGVVTQGMSMVVMPMQEGERSAALVLLDATDGFEFSGALEGDPYIDMLKRIAISDAAAAHDIERVAIEYVDEQGRSLISLTTTTQEARQFANGEIDEESFIKAIMGRVDPALLEEVL